MKNLFVISTSLLLLLVLVSFQNCGKVQFLSQDATLVPKVETEENHIIGGEERDPNFPAYESPEGSQEFICILDGPGKSVRLGVSSELLAENGRTPDTVCMSERACNEIVSQKFVIKGPEYRGFCPANNPHVIALTDEQVQQKINEL